MGRKTAPRIVGDELLAAGPVAKNELIRQMAPHVPVGQAIATAQRDRATERKRSGFASSVPASQIAPRGAKVAKGDLYVGSRAVARATLRNALQDKTWFINDDGLVQLRDRGPTT